MGDCSLNLNYIKAENLFSVFLLLNMISRNTLMVKNGNLCEGVYFSANALILSKKGITENSLP